MKRTPQKFVPLDPFKDFGVEVPRPKKFPVSFDEMLRCFMPQVETKIERQKRYFEHLQELNDLCWKMANMSLPGTSLSKMRWQSWKVRNGKISMNGCIVCEGNIFCAGGMHALLKDGLQSVPKAGVQKKSLHGKKNGRNRILLLPIPVLLFEIPI